MNLGERLRRIRNHLNISQIDVCRGADVAKSTYFNLETKSETANPDTLLKLSKFLDRMWQGRFRPQAKYPEINGVVIKMITVPVILYGKDEPLEELSQLVDVIHQDYMEREINNIGRVLNGSDGKET